MSRKPETIFRARAQKQIDTLPNTYCLSIQQLAKKGDPDVIMSVAGHFCAIEFKRSGGKTTKLQEYKLQKIKDSGGSVFVAAPENWDEVFSQLKTMADIQPFETMEEEE